MRKSKNSVSLSAVETEAVMHFSTALRLMGFNEGHMGPLTIYPARDGQEDTKRVGLCTFIDLDPIDAVMVLKKSGDRWELYCAASDINFGLWHASVWYDIKHHSYGITKFPEIGASTCTQYNIQTGERRQFVDS
jgi:hypothetical protein